MTLCSNSPCPCHKKAYFNYTPAPPCWHHMRLIKFSQFFCILILCPFSSFPFSPSFSFCPFYSFPFVLFFSLFLFPSFLFHFSLNFLPGPKTRIEEYTPLLILKFNLSDKFYAIKIGLAEPNLSVKIHLLDSIFKFDSHQ